MEKSEAIHSDPCGCERKYEGGKLVVQFVCKVHREVV